MPEPKKKLIDRIFKKKTAEEQIIEKKKLIEAMNTEVREMVKLAIKDGKLVPKTEDVEVAPAPQQQGINPEMVQQQQAMAQQEYLRQQEYAKLQMMQQEMQRQQMMRAAMQPAMTQQVPQRAQPYTVIIHIVGGKVFDYEVPAELAEDFFAKIDLAINEQSSFETPNTVVNGRHILYYQYQ